MSCFPESTYAVYVDGELPPDEVRSIESHLVGCRTCRALVLALRDEAALLSDALHDRAITAPDRRPEVAPARGIALGLVPTLVLGALALSVMGWLLETKLPGALGWMNPIRITGAYEMVFDMIFLLRDRVPGLIELIVGVVAMLSVSGLLTFALSAVTRRIGGPAGLSLLLVVAAGAAATVPGPARALELRTDERRVQVPAEETLPGTLVVSGDRVEIDGTVQGDLVVLAERLILRGAVEGNLFVTGRDVAVEGRVDGSLLAFAERVEVTGSVGGSVYTIAEQYRLSDAGRIARDAVHAGYGTVVEGSIGRDLTLFGDWAELRGRVGRSVDARIERLALQGGSEIGGDVDVVFVGRDEDLEQAPDARVSGEVSTRMGERDVRARWHDYGSARFYVGLAIQLAAAFAVGLILNWLWPAFFREQLATAGAFFGALGWGFVVVIATPFALALLAITLVGIPLALLGVFAFVTALYLAAIMVAALVGRALLPAGGDTDGGVETDAEAGRGYSFALALLVGLVVVFVVTHLPFVGGLLHVVAILTGLGILFGKVRRMWERRSWRIVAA